MVKGKGGHGAAPHTTIDPIVLSARIVLDLQTLVSRETKPTDPAVVTVGSIHGGTKHNIIPSEVKLQLTVRSTKDAVRKHLLEGIQRIARAAAEGAEAPEPTVKFDAEGFTPALVNDAGLTRKTVAAVQGGARRGQGARAAAGDGRRGLLRYGREGVPIFLFWLGTVAPDRLAEAAQRRGQAAAVAALRPVSPDPGTEHQDGRPQHVLGGDEPDGQAVTQHTL